MVPGPNRYRNLLRDTAIQLKGQPASMDTQALVLDQIMDEDRADRLILSWENFLSFAPWAVDQGRLYPAAAERVRARVLHTFELEQAGRVAYNRRMAALGVADLTDPTPPLA